MITPLPVPIHNRLQLTSKAVIRTNENPNFPDPATKIFVKIKAKVKIEFGDDFFKKENLQKHTVPNLHFLSKNSTFLGEKLVKMLWFWTF